MLSNAYFLAKFRFDTAENEPAKNLQKFAKTLQNLRIQTARLDVVGRLGLLHGEAEEGPLVVAHEPEARPGVQVVELAAAEVRRNLSYQLGQIDGPVCVPMFRI